MPANAYKRISTNHEKFIQSHVEAQIEALSQVNGFLSPEDFSNDADSLDDASEEKTQMQSMKTKPSNKRKRNEGQMESINGTHLNKKAHCVGSPDKEDEHDNKKNAPRILSTDLSIEDQFVLKQCTGNLFNVYSQKNDKSNNTSLWQPKTHVEGNKISIYINCFQS